MTTSRPIFLFPFPDGYWDGTYYYVHYRDYQNAVRATAANGRSYADNHYCPYGVPFSTSTDFGNPLPDRRLYGDKEMLTFLGYNTYDYSARHYFSPAASFDTPDPKAHDFTWISLYTFCAGNPVIYTDPTGERVEADERSQQNIINAFLYDETRDYEAASHSYGYSVEQGERIEEYGKHEIIFTLVDKNQTLVNRIKQVTKQAEINYNDRIRKQSH